ncbi:M42 family metallopeptidase [Candidatus Bathyarchaeota archaeon]|nr:M42 family metallopeptidase [Candidatus Bathyarchaeota archaeon]MBS7630816.1 M42 family metallopeptidase [Candidatus Bathyarchaeota archaeon]
MPDLYRDLEDLVLSHGPPGMEDEVRELISHRLKGFADFLKVDRMGNLIAIKGDGSPRIMLDAHMDEVGFVVKHISDEGLLWFELNGGVNEKTLLGQHVAILSRKGKIPGVIGAKSRHLLSEEEASKVTKVSDMWIDIGADNAKEASEMGVRVGDLCTFEKRVTKLGCERFSATSIDNRTGCLVLIEALRMLRGWKGTVYAAFTVQEEVGCRGAKTAAYSIDPDVAFVIDTTYGLDPATTSKETRLKIGAGPSIRALERSNRFGMGWIASRQVYNFILDMADEGGLKYQTEVNTMSITDASSIHLAKSGVPTGEILIPRRYSHSPVEVASMSDIEEASKLLVKVLECLDPDWVSGLGEKFRV